MQVSSQFTIAIHMLSYIALYQHKEKITSDVLAGWSVGAAWAMICWLVAYLVERRFKPSSASDAT